MKKQLTCNKFGIFYAISEDGILKKTEPFFDSYAKDRINSLSEMVQNETRIGYPMVRKSYLKASNPSNNHLRGQEEFIQISWDEALDLVAKQLKITHEKYGSESIYGDCYFWGGSGKVSWGRAVSRRMLSILGGFVSEINDYSTGAGLTIMPHVMGDDAVYGKCTKFKAILKNAKNVIFWGANPIATSLHSFAAPVHKEFSKFDDLKNEIKCGKIEAFSIDCLKNETQKFLQSEFISIKPNTDVALMLSMCYVLIQNDIYDKEFIQKYTIGFEKFKEYVLGLNDGFKKDPKWAENITSIKAEKIEFLAKKFRSEKTMMIVGRSLQRADHGEQTFWGIAVLNALLGHIGKNGCGFDFNLSYSLRGGDDIIAPNLKGINSNINLKYLQKYPNAPFCDIKMIHIPSSRAIEALANPHKVIDFNGYKIKLPHIKLMYNASSSWLTRHQDINNLLKHWQKIDTIITADPYWTSQAKFSDIVLPVATEFERYDINQSTDNKGYIIALKPAMKPFKESKSDFEICREICKRWGYEEVFTEEKDELAWVKFFYEDALNQAKNLNMRMPEFDEFFKKGFVNFTQTDKKTEFFTKYENFRKDPIKNPLATPSGKIEIYSKTIESFGYDDCPPHPTWLEPIEYLGNKTKKYPLHLISHHSIFRLHSQLNNATFLRKFGEINEREIILINPNDAKKRGINHGDIVKVFNSRGECLAAAFVSDDIKNEVVALCEGAWYDPMHNKLCNHGNVNVLTIDKGCSKLSQSNISHSCLVEIELYKEKLEPINAFCKPKIVKI